MTQRRATRWLHRHWRAVVLWSVSALLTLLSTYLQQIWANAWLLYPAALFFLFAPTAVQWVLERRRTSETALGGLGRKRAEVLDLLGGWWRKQTQERGDTLAISLCELENPAGPQLDERGQIDRSTLRPLPIETTLRSLFEPVNLPLLVLGGPGSGKSTMLLGLAHELAEQCRGEPEAPFPVLLNLSSWADARLPLEAWLGEQMAKTYLKQEDYTAHWLKHDQLILLLDGLDEVDAARREECAAAINTFQENYKVPLVVCCRSEEYARLATKIGARAAIEAQPLDDEQVASYLQAHVAEYEALQAWMAESRELRELAGEPLMLAVIAKVYGAAPAQAIDEARAAGVARAQLFDRYVEQLWREKGRERAAQDVQAAVERSTAVYTLEQTRSYLHSLSELMRGTHVRQTLFVVEEMQPDALPSRRWRLLYTVLDRGIGTLLGGAVGALVFLISWLVYALVSERVVVLGQLAYDAVLFTVTGAGMWGLFGGARASGVAWRGVVRRVLGGVTGTLLGILVGYAIGGQGAAVLAGVAWMVAGVLNGPPGLGPRQIVLAGSVVSVPSKILVDLPLWVMWGFAAAAAAVLLGFERASGLAGQVFSGPEGVFIAGGLLGVFFAFVLVGRTYRPLEEKELALRNRGVWQSAVSALKDGLLVGVGLFVLVTLFSAGPATGTMLGALAGLAYALAHGGYGALSHVILRVLLRAAGAIPRRFEEFLGFAERLRLVRRRARIYQFQHEKLQEYFAGIAPVRAAPQLVALRALAPLAAIPALMLTPMLVLALARPYPPTLADLPSPASGVRVVDDVGADAQAICVRQGERFVLSAEGAVRVGWYVGVVGPAGTDRGFLGLPLGDDFDTFTPGPHGALLVRLPGEDWSAWSAEPLTAAVTGCIAFDVNDVEPSNNQGAFFVAKGEAP